MPGRRLRHGVILIALSEERALIGKLPESPRQLALPAREVVRAQLIDGNDDDELRTWWRGKQRSAQPAEQREIRGESHGSETS